MKLINSMFYLIKSIQNSTISRRNHKILLRYCVSFFFFFFCIKSSEADVLFILAQLGLAHMSRGCHIGWCRPTGQENT